MANIRVSVPQTVDVLRVTDESKLGFTGYAVWLSCGHVMPLDDDETHMSLVGSETICRRHFEWVQEN